MSNITIDLYEDYCIYREFISEDLYLILVYCDINKKFYQELISKEKWDKITSVFDLLELEKIMKICINNEVGYKISFEINDDNEIITDNEYRNNDSSILTLKFECKEKVKTYKWEINLIEKSKYNAIKIQYLIDDLKNKLNLKNGEITYLTELQLNLEELFNNSKKEMLLIPYIHQLSQYDNKQYLKKIKKKDSKCSKNEKIIEELILSDDNDEVIKKCKKNNYDYSDEETDTSEDKKKKKIKNKKTCHF